MNLKTWFLNEIVGFLLKDLEKLFICAIYKYKQFCIDFKVLYWVEYFMILFRLSKQETNLIGTLFGNAFYTYPPFVLFTKPFLSRTVWPTTLEFRMTLYNILGY